MAKSILIPVSIVAKNVDAFNKSFVSATDDIDNGNVFRKGELSANADESQVYQVVKPTTGSLGDLWMAFSPEDNVVTDELGNQYKIGTLDPRAFTNKAKTVFSGFRINVGDTILISEDGIEGVANTHVIAENAKYKLKFNAGSAEAGVSFKVVKTTYISVAGAKNIGSQRVKAYLLECEKIN